MHVIGHHCLPAAGCSADGVEGRAKADGAMPPAGAISGAASGAIPPAGAGAGAWGITGGTLGTTGVTGWGLRTGVTVAAGVALGTGTGTTGTGAGAALGDRGGGE